MYVCMCKQQQKEVSPRARARAQRALRVLQLMKALRRKTTTQIDKVLLHASRQISCVGFCAVSFRLLVGSICELVKGKRYTREKFGSKYLSSGGFFLRNSAFSAVSCESINF